MSSSPLSVSALIPAPAADVYAILADYRDGHPGILPRPPFVALTVEAGGRGSGTVIRVESRVLGRRQCFRAVVTEPEPGRVLVESSDRGFVTTFTVEPRAGGTQSLVTISTSFSRSRGVLGAVERWVATRLLAPVYARELAQLEALAAERTG